MKKRVNLKNICEFAGIMDWYEEYLDGDIDRNTLIEECQDVLDRGREDLKNHPDFPRYTKYLGI